MTTTHTLITGDSRKMRLVHDKTVHLIITSPPYWQLKDYGAAGQIGFHDSYEEYINRLNCVWTECSRVLHDGCRLCVNIGDQFARSVYYGRYKVIPIRTEIIRFCETIGMDYMGAVIWRKQTTMHTTGGGAVMGSFPYPRNGILKIDYEFILIFKKCGEAPKPTPDQKEASKMTREEWNTFFSSHWTFGGARQDAHLAMFPYELPARLIRMFSFVGETVLDPFMGSGTTALAARNNGRNSIGYEINPNFVSLYKQKLNCMQTDLGGTAYSFARDDAPIDDNALRNSLPYVFHDPHMMDKRADIKERFFGSVIDKDSKRRREDLHTVTRVSDAITLVLDNRQTVRLLGVREKIGAGEAAQRFIADKVKGHKVFMRYDTVRHDKDDTTLCYLYLDNMTFINAHLLKAGLAEADRSIDYKYKDKFIKLTDDAI